MAESIYVRGENGLKHKMDLPLPEHVADRLTKGYLQRVNEDGSDYVAPADGSDLTSGLPARPSTAAPKAEWVGFVVNAYGMAPDAAEAMTKQDLIDKVTSLQGQEGTA